jgi:hypothetical protein
MEDFRFELWSHASILVFVSGTRSGWNLSIDGSNTNAIATATAKTKAKPTAKADPPPSAKDDN